MHVAKLNDQDWNNIISTTSNTRYYMRGSWPNTHDSGAINVGSLSHVDDFRKSSFSNFGPAIDIFAPGDNIYSCLLYTSPSPRDLVISRMPSSA